MLFNSIEFIIFFCIFVAIWPLVRTRSNPRWIYLTIASLFFYGWWDWRYLFLMCGTGLIDYFAGIAMDVYPSKKKPILFVSLAGNLGSLFFFKYLAFFTSNLNFAINIFGFEYQLPVMHFVLPVGISFYTFQSMSYAIDVYRNELKATYNVFHYFAFLSLFPQLVAGPIIRAADLLPQLTKFNKTTEQLCWEGLSLVTFGYFKKVVIADNLAPTINAAFSSAVPLDSAAYWWVIVTMFAFQIYCDFSGYSDIARGLAKWMGYEFMVNFDHPYTAASFREFWTRWHISLSTWFRDYVYIPLGGSRNGDFASFKNLWITMLASGFWHGASWTFIIWGALHAFYLSVERITNWPQKLVSILLGRYLAIAIVFVMVLISWVFFRAHNFSQALAILAAMFNFSDVHISLVFSSIALGTLLLLGGAIIRQLSYAVGINSLNFGQYTLKPIGVGMLLAGCVFLRGPGSAFIYFQF